MVIIKKGSDKVYTVTCPRCHSDLAYKFEKTYMEDKPLIFTTGTMKARCVSCPVCHYSVETRILN